MTCRGPSTDRGCCGRTDRDKRRPPEKWQSRVQFPGETCGYLTAGEALVAAWPWQSAEREPMRPWQGRPRDRSPRVFSVRRATKVPRPRSPWSFRPPRPRQSDWRVASGCRRETHFRLAHPRNVHSTRPHCMCRSSSRTGRRGHSSRAGRCRSRPNRSHRSRRTRIPRSCTREAYAASGADPQGGSSNRNMTRSTGHTPGRIRSRKPGHSHNHRPGRIQNRRPGHTGRDSLAWDHRP